MYGAGYHRAGYNRVMYGAHCKAEQQLPNNICQLLEICCQPVGEGATVWAGEASISAREMEGIWLSLQLS